MSRHRSDAPTASPLWVCTDDDGDVALLASEEEGHPDALFLVAGPNPVLLTRQDVAALAAVLGTWLGGAPS